MYDMELKVHSFGTRAPSLNEGLALMPSLDQPVIVLINNIWNLVNF